MPRRRRPPRAGALTELPPLRIAAQIASLQALYYFSACFLLLFTSLVSGSPFRFKMILGWDYLRGDTTQGWLLGLVWLLNGGLFMYVPLALPFFRFFHVVCSYERHVPHIRCAKMEIPQTSNTLLRSVAMVALVARSKLVPDFALTLHGIHLVLVTLTTRTLPRHMMWWLTMLASAALATGLGVWGCQYRELQPVFFGGGAQRSDRAPRQPPDLEEGEDELGRRVSTASEEIEMAKLEPKPL